MYDTLLQRAEAWQISLALLLSMLLFMYVGSFIGKIRAKNASLKESSGSVNYLSGLLFFLLAFTFGMGGNRYDNRRAVIIDEANAIGTALLRTDLYPAPERSLLRKDFKEYIESRIAFYHSGTDRVAVLQADSLSQCLAYAIWKRTAALANDSSLALATRLMIPAVNDMIDISTTRMYGELAKVPESIVWMLLILACINAFYIGYSSVMKGKTDWLVELGFCLLVSVVVLFTLDVDRPRRGFVTLDTPNQAIIDLRKNFSNE